MISAASMNKLQHIFTNFESSLGSIEIARQKHLIDDSEVTELLKKNSQRLIDRIKEFKIATRIISIFFAILFSYMQVKGEDLEMRRPARSGRTSSARASRARRRGEGEDVVAPF